MSDFDIPDFDLPDFDLPDAVIFSRGSMVEDLAETECRADFLSKRIESLTR